MLLTRAPLYSPGLLPDFPFDLHVLGTPPAFILSQDQTLRLNFKKSTKKPLRPHCLVLKDRYLSGYPGKTEKRSYFYTIRFSLSTLFFFPPLFSHSPNSENPFRNCVGNLPSQKQTQLIYPNRIILSRKIFRLPDSFSQTSLPKLPHRQKTSPFYTLIEILSRKKMKNQNIYKSTIFQYDDTLIKISQ